MPTYNLSNNDDLFPFAGENIEGSDAIFGFEGNDQITAGNGDDTVYGGLDNDTLYGGNGNDFLDAGALPLDHVLDGGADIDTAGGEFWAGVQNIATGQDVRVFAECASITFSVIIDGIVGTTLANIENFQISSGNANDRITGAEGNDTLSSLGGNDRIGGGAGDDRISKTWGRYDLDGGKGTDILSVSATDTGGGAGLVFDVGTGTLSSGGVTTGTFTRFETFIVSGTARADDITLGSRADTAAGGLGNDTIRGDAGDDLLDGAQGVDLLLGGAGNDTLAGGRLSGPLAMDADQFFGGSDDDLIFVNTPVIAGTMTFAGAVFDGGSGRDTLELQGTNAIADLTGATITGIETLAYGVTTTFGVILTSAAANGIANYTLGTGFLQLADDGAVALGGEIYLSQIRLAEGGQALDLTGAERPFQSFLGTVVGGSGKDTITGSNQRENIFGGLGNDVIQGRGGQVTGDGLYGGAGRDTVTGTNLADAIAGDADNDRLAGRGGADTVTGGTGRDRLEGGEGADQFVFATLADSAADAADADTIADFTADPAAGAGFIDRIVLSAIDAQAGGGTANDTFAFIGTAAFSAEGQVRVRQDGADTIVELNTAGTGGAEMSIRLSGITATLLDAADFVL